MYSTAVREDMLDRRPTVYRDRSACLHAFSKETTLSQQGIRQVCSIACHAAAWHAGTVSSMLC